MRNDREVLLKVFQKEGKYITYGIFKLKIGNKGYLSNITCSGSANKRNSIRNQFRRIRCGGGRRCTAVLLLCIMGVLLISCPAGDILAANESTYNKDGLIVQYRDNDAAADMLKTMDFQV